MAKAGGRPRRWSREQEEDIWARRTRGESLQQIATALLVSVATVRTVVARSGGVAPRPRTRSPRTLQLREREEISRGLAAGQSARAIAQALGRAPSTITREIARHGGPEHYRASQADATAWRRAERPKRCRLAQHPALCMVVAQQLEAGWSLMAVHPINRDDLPFRLITGLVDADRFFDVGINFPAVWLDASFSGVLPRGTPIAQCYAVPREAPTLVCEPMPDVRVRGYDALATQIMRGPGVYRKGYRSKRGGA